MNGERLVPVLINRLHLQMLLVQENSLNNLALLHPGAGREGRSLIGLMDLSQKLLDPGGTRLSPRLLRRVGFDTPLNESPASVLVKSLP